MPKVPKDSGSAPPTQPDRSMLDWALQWAEDGWPVFPLAPGTKIPLFKNPHPKGSKERAQCKGECGMVGHGTNDGTRDPEKIRKWWGANPSAGIGGATTDRVVFDFDFQHDAERKAVLPPTREHLSGRGNGNVHVVYRLGGDAARAISPGTGVLGPGVDVRAGRGAYVVLPPTRHPEGGPYTVANDTEEHYLTDDDVEAIWAAYGVKESATIRAAKKGISPVPKDTPRAGGGGGAPKLSDLLSNPPKRGEGQTNTWLTKVAGHYAKMHRDKRDLYEVEVRRAAAMVDPNYEETDTVLESVWGIEAANVERSATEASGYLAGDGRMLMCQAVYGSGDEREVTLAAYADFDIKARGVMVDSDLHRTYWVTVFARNRQVETTLAPDVLADGRRLAVWLARFGATIAAPDAAWPKIQPSVRLQRYLESQHPQEVKVVPHLGWDGREFITFDGTITAEGPKSIEQSGVIVDRGKVRRETAKYHYGFEETWERAQEVLRDVQGFHFEDVTALFGAFWAACFLRPIAMQYVSLFPYFGVEASSGSAKTNGYFALMVQLNGNYRGTVLPTTASFRDLTTANHCGIVWADDLDNPGRLEEILRASTSGGTVTKMGEDREVKDIAVVSPLLFTGEALGFERQKALADRGVIIHPSPPIHRTSLKPGREGVPQIDDIKDLEREYSSEYGLSVLSGWFVQEALASADQFVAVIQRLRAAAGRRGEKYAVLQAGARLLDHFLGHEGAWEGTGETAVRVDAWVADRMKREEGIEDDSVLTSQLIPWAISVFGPVEWDKPQLVNYRGSRDQIPPVLVQQVPEGELGEPRVWVNTALLARAWSEAQAGRVDLRMESPEGLARQVAQVAEPIKGGNRHARRIGGRVAQYRELLPSYARLVLDRAEGADLTE